MPALDLMKYRYSYINQDLDEVVKLLNEIFLGKFELVSSTQKFSTDKLKLVFVGVAESEQLDSWKSLIQDFYNGDRDALSLIEVVRHEAYDQYNDLKMAFVTRVGKSDIPESCSRCNSPAPKFTDMKGIYPSFNSKSQWFSSDTCKWSMGTELRDRNLAGFDPLFDHPDNALFEKPNVAITELLCPKCIETVSELYDEILKDIEQ